MALSSTSVRAGNGLAITHGAQSRIVDVNTPAVVAELRDALADAVPYSQPVDIVLVERAARHLARLRLLDEHLDRLGGSLIDSRGRQRGCARLYLSLERSFRETLTMLGIGPMARAQIAGPLAAVRSAQAAELAQERLRRNHRQDVEAMGTAVPTETDG